MAMVDSMGDPLHNIMLSMVTDLFMGWNTVCYTGIDLSCSILPGVGCVEAASTFRKEAGVDSEGTSVSRMAVTCLLLVLHLLPVRTLNGRCPPSCLQQSGQHCPPQLLQKESSGISPVILPEGYCLPHLPENQSPAQHNT